MNLKNVAKILIDLKTNAVAHHSDMKNFTNT